MLERYGEEFFNGDYEKKISYYIENDVLEEGKRANKALREEMVISEALSQEYHSLLKLDAETGEMSLYRTDGFGMKKEMLQELLVFCQSRS